MPCFGMFFCVPGSEDVVLYFLLIVLKFGFSDVNAQSMCNGETLELEISVDLLIHCY